jgi:peptidoglycan/LPS O-acetylase OafA/YrhL
MIALIFSGIRVHRLIGCFFIVAIFAVFIFYPAGAEREDLTEGMARILLTFLSVSLVFFIYRTRLSIHKILSNRFLFLGKVSYSVYLLHPLVGLPMAFIFEYFGLGVPLSYVVSIVVTLYISHLSYKYVEKPMINKGKLVANRVNI